jgi:hypothetical protein
MENKTKAEKIIRQEIEKWSILKPTTVAKNIMKALNEANLIFVKRNVIKSACDHVRELDGMMCTGGRCSKCNEIV